MRNKKKKPQKGGPKNQFERKIGQRLKTLTRANSIFHEYEGDKLNYILYKKYIPDYTIQFPDGRKMFIEVKGYLRPEDRTKMIAVKKMNPDLDIRFVFYRNNKLNKNSRTLYSDWATNNGFQYAIGTIPKEWLS